MQNLTQKPTVHLVVSDLYPGDAIGNFVLAVGAMLQQKGILYKIYAERFDASVPNVQPYSAFFKAVQATDVLLYQLSNYDPEFENLMHVLCRKVVYYHNITPGHFFAPYSPETAEILDKGRAELHHVAKVDALLANSAYSLAEVESYLPQSVPRSFFPPFLHSQITSVATSSALPHPACAPKEPYFMTLGRIVPHKCIEKALDIFVPLSAAMPELKLVLVGSHYEPYAANIAKRIAATPELAQRVTITGKLPLEDVTALLANASGLLHTSAHEGFCLPVFEAMLAQVLVFAHHQEAVMETLGGTGVLFDADKPEQAAARILSLLCDPVMRERTLSAQLAQAKRILKKADEQSLLAMIYPF